MSGDDFLVIWKLNGRNPRFWNATAEQIRADVPKLSLSSLLPHRPRIFDLSPPPPLQLCRLRLSAQTRCLHKLRIIYRYKYGGITETIKDEVLLYIIWISLFHSLFHQQVVSSSLSRGITSDSAYIYIYMQNVRPKLYQVKAKAWFRVGFQITWRIIGDNFSICWISVRTGCRYWRGVLMWENVNDYWIWDLINFRNIWFFYFLF